MEMLWQQLPLARPPTRARIFRCLAEEIIKRNEPLSAKLATCLATALLLTFPQVRARDLIHDPALFRAFVQYRRQHPNETRRKIAKVIGVHHSVLQAWEQTTQFAELSTDENLTNEILWPAKALFGGHGGLTADARIIRFGGQKTN
jgi:hypothetical protein